MAMIFQATVMEYTTLALVSRQSLVPTTVLPIPALRIIPVLLILVLPIPGQ
jgi:hypothetical protein